MKFENHDEVIHFLNTKGGNKKLGQTLSKRGQFSYGPIEYSLEKIGRIIGPEVGMVYHEEISVWNGKIDKMVEELENGWEPAPLIATNLWKDSFTLADGNHRREALIRHGVTEYPTIFYFKTDADRKNFIQNNVRTTASR